MPGNLQAFATFSLFGMALSILRPRVLIRPGYGLVFPSEYQWHEGVLFCNGDARRALLRQIGHGHLKNLA